MEGAGKAGCATHPRPRVRNDKAHELVTTGLPDVPGLPCAMVLTGYLALSPVTGLSCHRRPQDHHLTSLTPASGRQDHTTSPSASGAFRLEAPKRPPHPAPTFMTIAKRPSDRSGTAVFMDLIWANREGKYFYQEDWTGSISLIGFEKFGVWRILF